MSYTVMRDNFGETPCRDLMVPGLQGNAFLSARSFVDTNRLKEWKPQNINQVLDPNFKYCYLDNDSNVAKDFIMEKYACDVTSEPFSSALVSDAFQDASLDKTRTFPVNKCVLKINKDALTVQNATTFWNRMSQVNCQQIAGPITDDNYRLTLEKDTCIRDKQTFSSHLNDCKLSLASKAETLSKTEANWASATAMLGKAEGERDRANGTVQDLSQKLQIMQDQFTEYARDATSKERINNNQRAELQKSLAETQKQLTIMSAKYSSTATQLLDLSKNYSTLEATHMTLVDTYNSLRNQSAYAIETLDKCNKEKEVMSIKLRQASAQGALYQSVVGQLNTCTTNFERLKQTCKETEKSMHTYRTNAAEMQRALNETTAAKAVMETQMVEMMQQIKLLKEQVGDLDKCKISLGQSSEANGVLRRKLMEVTAVSDGLQNMSENLQIEVTRRMSNLISGQINFICANSDLSSKNLVMQETVANLSADITALLSRYNTMSKQCTQSGFKNQDLTRVSNDLSVQLAATQNINGQMQRRIDTLQNMVSSVMADNQTLISYINARCPRN